MQITGSFATCKSPRPRPSQPCAFPAAERVTALPLPMDSWQSKACPDTRPLRARELHQEGKEQIFQLCLSSLHFKGCAWVWERTKRVCQSTCKTSHSAAPTARLSLRTRAGSHLPLPTELISVVLSGTNSISLPSYLSNYTCPLIYIF